MAVAVRLRLRPSRCILPRFQFEDVGRREFCAAASSEACHPGDGGSGTSGGSVVQSRSGSPLCLYESREDILSVAKAASRKCYIGTALGLVGFAGVAAGSVAAPPILKGALAAGAAFYVYKHCVLSQRMLAQFASRHVERLDLVDGKDRSLEDVDAATELQLQIRTANLLYFLRLVPPRDALEGSRYAGFVADEHTSFSALWRSKELLYHEDLSGWGKPSAPTSENVDLLCALADSPKVLGDHRVQCREDVDDLLRLPSTTAKAVEFAVSGIASAASSSSEAKRALGMAPAVEMEQQGRQAIIGGLIFVAAGGLFVGRQVVREPADAVIGKDPKLSDMFQRLTARA